MAGVRASCHLCVCRSNPTAADSSARIIQMQIGSGTVADGRILRIQARGYGDYSRAHGDDEGVPSYILGVSTMASKHRRGLSGPGQDGSALKDSPLSHPGSGGPGDDRQDNSSASPTSTEPERSESDPE